MRLHKIVRKVLDASSVPYYSHLVDHLLVTLQLAGQHAPVLCIPQDVRGLMRAAAARAFEVRIARADDGDNDGKVWLHVVWHARGQVSAFANLRGASFMVADRPEDIALWTKRRDAHRASVDFERSGVDSLPLPSALALAACLDSTGLLGWDVDQLRRNYGRGEEDRVRVEVLADRTQRDGLILCSLDSTGGLYQEGLTPAAWATMHQINWPNPLVAIDPYGHDGEFSPFACANPLIANYLKIHRAPRVGGSTCAA